MKVARVQKMYEIDKLVQNVISLNPRGGVFFAIKNILLRLGVASCVNILLLQIVKYGLWQHKEDLERYMDVVWP